MLCNTRRETDRQTDKQSNKEESVSFPALSCPGDEVRVRRSVGSSKASRRVGIDDRLVEVDLTVPNNQR